MICFCYNKLFFVCIFEETSVWQVCSAWYRTDAYPLGELVVKIFQIMLNVKLNVKHEARSSKTSLGFNSSKLPFENERTLLYYVILTGLEKK